MQLYLLGTGTPNPDPRRAASGTAVDLCGGSGWLLVDCGRGVTQRALEAGLALPDLRAVFLTHHHTDHVSDLATLAITRFVAGAATPLLVVVPDGPCRRFAERCLEPHDDSAFHSQRVAGRSLRPDMDVVCFAPTDRPTTVWEVDGASVVAALVDHGPVQPSVGYRIGTGTSAAVVSGDTVAGEGVRRLAADVDVLIHQALRTDLVTPETLTWNASARSVGELARDLAVPHLVLTHLMPSPTGPGDEAAFEAEARSGGYEGPITIARDLATIAIP